MDGINNAVKIENSHSLQQLLIVVILLSIGGVKAAPPILL
jgi:hypothetical protein